jgi:hypothetical protein
MTDYNYRVTQFFATDHLKPGKLRDVAEMYKAFKTELCATIESNPELTVALRRLLDSKDAACRATIYKEESNGNS